MNLLLLDPHEVRDGRVVLRDARAHHLLTVLRVAVDQRVRVGLVDGPFGTATVIERREREVELQCHFEPGAPASPRIDLLLALPRPKVLQRLWAQLAALGVGRILLTNAGRVERNYFDTHALSPDVYRPLLIEGLQQARDTRVPIVTIHRRFRVLVEDDLDALAPDAARIVADPAAGTGLFDVASAREGRVLLAVGPEGGWNGFELALLERHGFERAALDHRALRSDTACIALLAVAHEALRRGQVRR